MKELTLEERINKAFQVEPTWTKEDEKNLKYITKIWQKILKFEYQIQNGKTAKIKWQINER
jgi:methyl coenzyme M reductase subunit D